MIYKMSMILAKPFVFFLKKKIFFFEGCFFFLWCEQVRLRGVDGGDEGVSQKDAAQGVEGVDAVFSGRGDIAADTAEVHEGVKAAEGAGDLLAQLHHSQITLRKVVIERDREVADESKDAVVVIPESVEQVACFALF